MAQPVLELSEHELYFLPPGTPAVAPATRVEVEVEGEVRAFLARLEWMTYPDHPGRRFYWVFYRAEEGEVVLCDGASASVLTIEKVRGLMTECVRSSRILRLWHPPDTIWQATFSKDGGDYLVWREGEFDLIHFRWEQSWRETEFSSYPRSAFFEFCERLRADENSELSYALRWHEFTPEQKSERAFSCENGNWEDLRRVFALAQIVLVHHRGVFQSHRSGESRWQFDLRHSPSKTTARKWALRWRAAICEIMRPSFWLDEPLCHRDWRRKPLNENRCKVKCGIPTHHEFLEAQLELRDFLRPYLPAAAIEALMRPD